MVKQLSILIDQRPERLAELISFLKTHHIDLRFAVLTTDSSYSVLRALSPDAQGALKALQDAGYTAFLRDTLFIEMGNRYMTLTGVLDLLSAQNIPVEEFVWVSSPGMEPSLLCRASDMQAAGQVLRANGMRLLDDRTLWGI